MAKTARSGVKPPQRWRCMVEGCVIYKVWQEVVPGEEFMMDTADPRGHYWRAHYLDTEREYHRKLAEQQQKRREHYALTGEFLPPEF